MHCQSILWSEESREKKIENRKTWQLYNCQVFLIEDCTVVLTFGMSHSLRN
jgi:hypothetical protein